MSTPRRSAKGICPTDDTLRVVCGFRWRPGADRGHDRQQQVGIDDLAATLPPGDPASARLQALSLYAGMVGTLQMSRALADRTLADAILEQGIRNALALLEIAQRT
jgi:hypothetical protein